MKTILRPIIFLLIFPLGHFGIVSAQAEGEDVVLVQGNPPLTQLTVGKAIVLLEWALDNWALPPEGLLYFDPAVAERVHPDDWGTYEMKNGEIHILRGPRKSRYVITRSGERLNNPPSLGKGSFRPE